MAKERRVTWPGESPLPNRRHGARRYVAAMLVALCACGLSFTLSLAIGPKDVGADAMLGALFQYDAANEAHLIVRDIRLPRALLGLLVGGSLAMAGAVMQGVTRNPLAGPSIMGLSGGGTLLMLVALIAVPGLSYNGSIAASFLGALGGFAAVMLVATMSPGGFAPARMALAGTITSALLSSVTQGLVICYAMAGDMLYWTAGGIANVTWAQVAAIAPCVVLGAAAVAWLAPSITILNLGSETAVGLGQRTSVVRAGATLSVLVLTAGAVAAAGPISFVGLMVPHACRLAAGGDYRRIIPLSALVGAALTSFADVAARTVLGQGREIPLGVVTAAIGAPCFVWLVRQRAGGILGAGAPTVGAGAPRWRPQATLLLLAGLLVVVGVAALHVGFTPLSPQEVWRALTGESGGDQQLTLTTFRLPRIVFAMLVGSGIAVAGAAMQAVLRNDLVEPGILGVSAGASLAVVLSLALFGYSVLTSVVTLPLVAIVGSMGAMAAVYLLCLGPGRSSTRLLLTGVAVSSALGAATLLASLQISSQAYAFAVAFSAGSLSSAGWNYVMVLAVWLGILAPVLWSQATTLNALRLGDDAATGLGVAVARRSILVLTTAVALCAACMALAGGVTFLGLIAPHVSRRLVGANHAFVLPASGFVGAILLVAADMLGSQAVTGVELPAGVIVSALGAPYYLYLMTRR